MFELPSNPAVVETTFEKTKIAKLRKRIHLPPELQIETHEERHICYSIGDWIKSYNHTVGWSVIFLDNRHTVIQALQKEVILREHRLGKFILFRVWKEQNGG